jgi:hypothetical protein
MTQIDVEFGAVRADEGRPVDHEAKEKGEVVETIFVLLGF